MRVLYVFLLCLSSLYANGQNTTIYEGGEAFAVRLTNNKVSTKIPIGLGGKVIYNSFFNSYTVTWVKEDGTEQEMKFKYVGESDDVKFFKEEAGKSYVIENENLNTEGTLIALQIDLENKTVSNKGLLVTKLKRK